MCRLAYIPGNAKINYKEMVSFLTMLEKSCGGDGNGYVAVSREGQIVSNKGAKLSVSQIVKQTYKLLRNDWSVYFHTRKVSIGWIDDNQCHPFEIKGKYFQGWLCHNGTWMDGGVMAKYFGCGSDTAAFARLIGQFGLKRLKDMKLFPSSGVFLLYGSKPKEIGLHRVLNIHGDLEYCPNTGIWASEFDKTWKHWTDTYNVATGRHMLDKAPPKKAYAGYYNGSNCGYVASPTASTSTTPRFKEWASDVESKLWSRYDDDHTEDIPDYTVIDRNLLS